MRYQYLIYLIFKNEAFFTNWYGDELMPDEPHVCFNLDNDSFTTDGNEWHQITEDHL